MSFYKILKKLNYNNNKKIVAKQCKIQNNKIYIKIISLKKLNNYNKK